MYHFIVNVLYQSTIYNTLNISIHTLQQISLVLLTSLIVIIHMKLVTYLQRTQHITRREFKDMLDEQVIFVNEELVTSFDQQITIKDTIKIVLPQQGTREKKVNKLTFQPPKLILFNKPKGYVVSKDDKHNKTIYDLLPASRHDDFWYIGRLDKDSTGLLLLTNDPKLVDEYENPKNNIHKVYQVEIDKPLRSKDKIRASKGIEVTEDGTIPRKDNPEWSELLKCVTVNYTKTNKGKHEVIITLNEGKKRHIRRLLKALGYKVYKLHRLKVGKRHIGSLKPGKRRIEKIKRGKKK